MVFYELLKDTVLAFTSITHKKKLAFSYCFFVCLFVTASGLFKSSLFTRHISLIVQGISLVFFNHMFLSLLQLKAK